ncbi:unnamed protein product [Penicillium camemberti]|uniref:Str. FM013 n=1 Tax=Penicillium camemberti (strain FM 013) TaxID=1429867 RepID=A0A0G4NZM0_PENC3|nr:unnamed protein product [Penicillium camemberti]
MIGTIFWECVCCPFKESRSLKVKFRSSDPGSCWTAVWSFILPAKRRVYIHTVCRTCIEERDFTFPDEQLSVIFKARELYYFENRSSWASTSWRYWVPSSECQAVNNMILRNGKLTISLAINVSLS